MKATAANLSQSLREASIRMRIEKEKRPPEDRGQGRKPIHPSGELMKPRQIRMTDAEWEDAKLVGPQEIRAFVTKRAKKKRSTSPANSEKEADK